MYNNKWKQEESLLYMEEACCRFDEKTEKHVDSSISSVGAVCMLIAVLWSMQLIWSGRKRSLPCLLCHKKAEKILLR